MFGNTMNFIIDSPINAMAVSRDGAHLAVAGRSLLKVFSLADDSFGSEQFNLRSSNLKNLNFSNNDVTWCPLDDGVLATAATNGGVVVWNLNHSAKSKIDVVFNDHKRTVNKVCFHSAEPNYLLSGSQDGCMKLFDLRRKEASATFVSNSESVRDVQFSPSAFSNYHFASVQETGNVEIWDIRRTDKPESNFIAHDGPVFACEWHPNQDSYKWLATGGRDKTIKVWDLTNPSKPKIAYNVHTIAPVSKLKWRPTKDMHIGSCSLVVDFSVYVWDIKRPYVPYAIFGTRKDVTTGFAWKDDPYVFISSCKDGTIYQHRFETDAYYPAEHYPPIGIDLNPAGDVVFSMTDFIHRYSQYLNTPNSAVANGVPNGNVNEFHSLALQSSRLIKTHSLGTNSIITATGIMSSANQNLPVNHQQQPSQALQPYPLSSSLTQNNWEIPASTSVSEPKIMNRVHSMANQYLPSQFQYHHSLQLNHSTFHVGAGHPNNALTPSHSASQQHQYPVYNISVPISYKKTSEPILSEHFRCMVSYMMFFLSRDVQDSNHGLLQNYNAMKHFIEFAKSYKLADDDTFEELCMFNASVADSLDRHQIAQTWRIVRHMFSVAGRHPTSSGGAGNNNPSGGSVTNTMPIVTEDKLKNENPSRHTSGGTRHYSGNNIQPSNAGAGNTTGKGELPHHEDEDQEIQEIDGFYLDTLKDLETIPKNRFVVDFFELQPQAESDVGDQGHQRMENIFNYYDNTQDWELQRESIMHRHNIVDCSNSINEFGPQNPVLPDGNYDVSSPVSFDDEEEAPPTDTNGLFDVNLQSLVSAKYPTPPNWPFTEIVGNMLRHYVDQGDVQTAVHIILVLGDKMRLVTDIDRDCVINYFRNYIDLLNRFQLWNVSCRLIKLSQDPDIYAINQTSTTVHVYCAKCHKAIKVGTVCEKCSMEPSNCAICHVSVRGCAHGGHLQHMLEWFKNNSKCPAGCGHHCELC